MSKRIKMLDPAMKYGSALKTVRADIDVLVRNYFQLQAELEDMKRLILDHCATMGPTETITEGVYTKSQPILDREKAVLMATYKDVEVPYVTIQQVDYRELEERLKKRCDEGDLVEIYKPKAASIGQPRQRRG